MKEDPDGDEHLFIYKLRIINTILDLEYINIFPMIHTLNFIRITSTEIDRLNLSEMYYLERLEMFDCQ